MKYIITGTSSGLGFELASKLVKKNEVVGISRNIGKSESLLKHNNFAFIPYDLSTIDNKKKYIKFKKRLLAEVDKKDFTLIFNAAQFYLNEKRLSIPKIKIMFKINLFSIMDLIENFKNHNLKRIFIINSVSGLVGQPTQHEYVSSKHALMGYVRSLIKEAKDQPFDIMCINPGGIKTELWNKYVNVDKESFILPSELARIIISLLKTKQKLFIENMKILPIADV